MPVAPDNSFNRVNARLQSLPLPQRLRERALTFGAGMAIPFLATSSVELLAFDPSSAKLRLRNRRKVQNHMKSVHASAMFLLAESATGTVLSANLPQSSRFSVTRSEVTYVRKAVGDLTARAFLDDAQQRMLREGSKGRLVVPVELFDEEGNEPARFVIEWAWKHPSAKPTQP